MGIAALLVSGCAGTEADRDTDTEATAESASAIQNMKGPAAPLPHGAAMSPTTLAMAPAPTATTTAPTPAPTTTATAPTPAPTTTATTPTPAPTTTATTPTPAPTTTATTPTPAPTTTATTPPPAPPPAATITAPAPTPPAPPPAGPTVSTIASTPFDQTNDFFAAEGTNARTCQTCHGPAQGWSVTPAFAKTLPANAPLFAFDGSDCLPAGVVNASAANSTQMLGYANTRVELPIPSGADFTLASAVDPLQCATPPSASALRMYRRAPQISNVAFLSTVMWDGREDVTSSVFGDLEHQANDATTGHEQGSPLGDAQQSSVATFESTLFTATTLEGALALSGGAPAVNGGPTYLQSNVLPAFVPGQNDPLAAGFTPIVFDLYAAWEPGQPVAPPSAVAASIGRGEVIFNTRRINIVNVPGLNGPNDPSQAAIAGSCSTCHNNRDVGNHTLARFFDIGATSVNPPGALDVARLPVYTFLQSKGGAQHTVTDPGRALVTGLFADIGKTKVPTLRGLASRPPYFHNGGAATLPDVVGFYDARFRIGLTPADRGDLVAFLAAL